MSFRQSLQNFMHWPLKAAIFATWLPAVIFFNDHVGDVTWITGASMYPYFNGDFHENMKQDICWTRRWKPTQELKRGMIVSFRYAQALLSSLRFYSHFYRSPFHPEVFALKRVVAMEGDTIVTRAPYPIPKVQIPANHVWVEGDNPDVNKTLDSNTYGPIPLDLIEGRVTHILWPWKRSGALRWEEFNSKRVIRRRADQADPWNY
jgi:inner membrane protease subunit 2